MSKMRKAKPIVLMIICFLSAALAISVQAAGQDDGRINPPNFHFGGDTLYCDPDEGCHVLNLHGDLLVTWVQDSISSAAEQSNNRHESVLVGTGAGTYGPLRLWVQSVEEDPDKQNQWILCMDGYDEWGKWNDMCFHGSLGGYEPIGVAAPVAPAAAAHVANCSAFTIGDPVWLIADHSVTGLVTSINTGAGTVTFHNTSDVTASCDVIEVAPL